MPPSGLPDGVLQRLRLRMLPVVTAGSPTKLTAWFDLNIDDEDLDVAGMEYCDIPTHYRWDAATKVKSDLR